MIYPYKKHMPDIHPTAFVADNATITGDVVIGEQSSIWFSVVIRGDVAPTRIGNRVNIQDLKFASIKARTGRFSLKMTSR